MIRQLIRGVFTPRLPATSVAVRPMSAASVARAAAPWLVRKITTPEDIPSVLKSPVIPTPWIVPGWIVDSAYHIIAGESGSMKSTLALSMANAMASGGELFGEKISRRQVIYLDRENPQCLIRKRFDLLKVGTEDGFRYWGCWAPEEPPKIGSSLYLEWARRYRPVFIFDSLVRFHERDENSASEMRLVSESFCSLRALGATVIVLHHQGKPGLEGNRSPYRGSSEIKAGCDIGYSIAKTTRDGSAIIEVECFKNRWEPERGFTLRFDSRSGLFVPEELPSPHSDEEHHMDEIAKAIEAFPGSLFEDLRATTGLPHGKLRVCLGKGDGTRWKVKAGPHNQQKFYPVVWDGAVE